MHKDVAKFLNILSIPINGIFTYLNFSEYYIVAIQKEVATYHFGASGHTPYYYETAALYAAVCLSYGSIFLFLLCLGIWNIKTNKVHGHLMLMGALGIILFKMIYTR